jgi:hypothetical protein
MSTNGKVYVEGLPYATTGEQLAGLCRQHGKVKSARVVILFNKATSQWKGFGLVEMESLGDHSKVVAALHQSDLDGATLRCFSLSHPARDDERGS